MYYEYYHLDGTEEKLSVTEKQQALLQGAVIESSSLPETDLTFDDKKADFTLEAGKGCKIKDGKIIVTKKNAKVSIGYQGEPDAEGFQRIFTACPDQ